MIATHTIPESVLKTADRTPDKISIVCEGQSITYGAFAERMSGVAGYLETIGVKKGDRVGITIARKVEFLLSVVASMAVGAIPVPIPRIGDREFEPIVENSDPKVLISDQKEQRRTDESFASRRIILLEEALDSGKKLRTIPKLLPEDVAMIFYTSGTTSRNRKGVLVTCDNFQKTVSYMNGLMELTHDVVEYVIPPISHAFGFGRCRAVFHAGGMLVLDNGVFRPPKAILAVKEKCCNSISATSTGVALLLEHYERYIRPLGGQIKWIEIGSLPLSVSHKMQMLEIFPNAKIFMEYGLTEAMRSTLINFRTEAAKIATVGRPSPGVSISAKNEDGKPQPPGTVGELCVSGVNVAKGFWKNDLLWQQRFQNGWLRTGDVGIVDREGYVTYLGRKDDMINVGGEKFYPDEVEPLLADTLKNGSYCVCGMSDPDGVLGDIPVLCVEGKEGIVIKDIQKKLRGKIEEFKLPKEVVFLERLPRTGNGKIKRGELRGYIEKWRDA